MKTFLTIAFAAVLFVGCNKAGSADYHNMTAAEMDKLDRTKQDSIMKAMPAEESAAITKAAMKYATSGDSTKLMKMTIGELIEEGKKMP